MQKEKPTKVYTGSKNQEPKKPKKQGSDFLNTFTKSAKFIINKAMAGSVQHIAILVAAGVLTVAVLGGAVWGVASLVGGAGQGTGVNEIEIDPEADNKYDKNAAVIDTSKYASTILQETEDAGQQYISETLFVGDSNTVRSLMYDVTGNTWENVVGAVGIGIQHVASSPFPCVTFTQPADPVDIVTAIKWIQPKRVVFTFGTNNASWTVDSFIEEYKKAIETAYAAYPYFDVIVNAIPPVDKIRDYPNVTMQQIDAFNAALAQMCEDEGYKFLNSAEVLKDDETGFAKKDYTISDGIHLSKNGFTALFDYIRTHAYETEDRRPELTYCPKRNEIEMPTIIQDPVAIRGGLKVIFTSSDYTLGSVDGEIEQYVKYTKTSDAVTAVAKSENGGIFTGWSCEYGGISDPGASTITFTAPQLSEEITTVTITANFKKGDVDISKHSMNLKVGESDTLSASASGGHSIKWSSSNESIAKVDKNGKVTAVAPGTAKITASALDGQMSASCTVTVQPTATPTPAVLESITIKLTGDSKEMTVGSTLDISIATKPANAQLGTVTWTSSDATIATVAANGSTNKITALKEGKVTITASTNNGKLKDSVEITVVAAGKPLTGISIAASPTTIEVGQTTTVKATKAPADTTDKTAVEFTSSNISVATVEKSTGVVKGVSAGTAVITAKCGNYSAEITITVNKAHEHTGGTATCKEKAKCSVCQKEYGDLLTTHTWVEATCKDPKKCSVCGKTEGTKTDSHIWVNATCAAPKTCSVCGKTDGSKLEHTAGAAPTCGEAQKCTACGAELAKATGNHTWVNATCTEPKTCSVCKTTDGSALGHTPGKEATCTEAQKCTVCSAEIKPAKGHSANEANCTTASVCSTCNATLKDALGHDMKDATCTEPKKCSRCGTTEGDKLGHDMKDATCTEPKKCSRCGTTEGSALGHTPGQEATCTEAQKCTVCSAEINSAKGHSKGEDGKCTSCGETLE